jgi:hypothetical protein
MTRGGPRTPAPGKKLGRPAVGRMRSIRMSDEEYDKVREYLKELRRKKDGNHNTDIT